MTDLINQIERLKELDDSFLDLAQRIFDEYSEEFSTGKEIRINDKYLGFYELWKLLQTTEGGYRVFSEFLPRDYDEEIENNEHNQ